ncbi:MAG: hypothetical protein C7B47_03040 [Sulfobacillus thermosulfidooxidans]|uniref:Glycosyltransferase 2-like domain-containing protein n=1 Tax=Sulfobacillus thermosulfidooxidans TaxID=28034 RepID=A0A2T2X367_SULTH|nr:MAG: hypothetical protein C7B47_03040 [Sulfobacillus thermosulfidooxidans]
MSLSVIIPTYNVENYIGQCLESIQTWPESEVEIIVVDDHSQDQTATIVEDLKAQQKNIKLFRQPETGGPGMARNRGIQESHGTFLLFLDADNWMDKSFWDVWIHNLFPHQSEWDVVFWEMTIVNDKTITSQRFYHDYILVDPVEILQSSPYELFYRSLLDVCAIMRRDPAIYFTNYLSFLEDWELWSRLWYHQKRFYFIKDSLSYYRKQRPDSQTAKSLERAHLRLSDEITILSRNLKYIVPGSDPYNRIIKAISERIQQLLTIPLHQK